MLTYRELDIVRGLDVEADDYIVKPLNFIVFMARVKAVLRQTDLTLPFEDKVFNYGDLKVDFGRAKVTLGPPGVSIIQC